MKKFLSFILLFLCIIYKTCIGDIQPIHHLQEIIPEVQMLIDAGIEPSKIVVAFDLDDTLIRTCVSRIFIQKDLRGIRLSSAFLYEYVQHMMHVDECTRRGLGEFKSLSEDLQREIDPPADLRAHDIVLCAQKNGCLTWEVVEKETEATMGTVAVLNRLRSMGVRILGITARTWYMKDITNDWFPRLDITMDSTPEFLFEEDVDGFCGVSRGVVYTKWNIMNKGKALTLFFEKTHRWPQALLIVDDSKKFLERAERYFTNPETQGGRTTKKYFWYDFAENTPSLFDCEGTPTSTAEEKGRQAKAFLECMLGQDWVYAPVAQPWRKS